MISTIQRSRPRRQFCDVTTTGSFQTGLETTICRRLQDKTTLSLKTANRPMNLVILPKYYSGKIQPINSILAIFAHQAATLTQVATSSMINQHKFSVLFLTTRSPPTQCCHSVLTSFPDTKNEKSLHFPTQSETKI